MTYTKTGAATFIALNLEYLGFHFVDDLLPYTSWKPA